MCSLVFGLHFTWFNNPGGGHTQTLTNKHAYRLPGQNQFQETRHMPGLKTI